MHQGGLTDRYLEEHEEMPRSATTGMFAGPKSGWKGQTNPT